MDSLNHAVVVVGYEKSAKPHGAGFWWVKNSWSEDWVRFT
jgi:C1A family cysteine protease